MSVDEIIFGEDICCNYGSLISPAMMHEFILSYFQQLIANTCDTASVVSNWRLIWNQ